MEYYYPSEIDLNIKTNNDDLKIIPFKRHYIDEMAYNYTLSTIKNKHNFIKNKLFERNDDPDVLQQISVGGSKVDIVVCKNSFDYRRPKALDQYLIWVDNNMANDEVLKYIEEYIQDKDYMIWTNGVSSYSSLPQIKHFHLMVQRITPKMTLKKMIMVARHGPRAPLNYSLKLDLPCWDGYDRGDITKGGINCCRDFGKYIRGIYNRVFTFDKSKIIVKSSGTKRTLISAKYFIKGLFDDESLDIDASVDTRICGCSKLTYDQMITFKHFARQIKLDFNSSILKYVTESNVQLLNSKILELFGFKIKYLDGYFNIYSILQCYIAHDKNLIPKQWTGEDMELLQHLTTFFYSKLFDNEQFMSLFLSDLLISIDELSKNDDINFVYISTHDSIVYPLALKLANTVVKLPEFCSNVRYEFWDNATRIYYDDLLIVES